MALFYGFVLWLCFMAFLIGFFNRFASALAFLKLNVSFELS